MRLQRWFGPERRERRESDENDYETHDYVDFGDTLSHNRGHVTQCLDRDGFLEITELLDNFMDFSQESLGTELDDLATALSDRGDDVHGPVSRTSQLAWTE